MGNDGSKSRRRDGKQVDQKHAVFLSDYRKPLHDALVSVMKNPDFASLILDFLNPIYLFLQTPNLELHCKFYNNKGKIVLKFNPTNDNDTTNNCNNNNNNNKSNSVSKPIPFNYYNYNVAESNQQNEGAIVELNNVLFSMQYGKYAYDSTHVARNLKIDKVYLQKRLLNMRHSSMIGKKGNFKLTDYIV